ncbi:hypothetical protein ES708_07990 [subsurface metagenome]
MNRAEAIEILKSLSDAYEVIEYPDLGDALKVGIKDMEFFQTLQEIIVSHQDAGPQGETRN